MRNTPEIIKSKMCYDPIQRSAETYSMEPICFSTKMMNKFTKKGGDQAIIEMSPGAVYFDREIPQKNHCYYIAEPFCRLYDFDVNGISAPSQIVYQTTKDKRRCAGSFNFNDNNERKDGVSFMPQAMLQEEARLFIRVRWCRYRYFGSLSLGATLHENTYELKKTSQVLLVGFDVVTKQEAFEQCAKLEWEKFYDEYM